MVKTMNINELSEELTKRNINISARRISEIWGMDEASFSRKKRLGSEIKFENIKQLEKELNINLTNTENTQIPVDCIPVTYLPEIYLSAGFGLENYNENQEKMMIDAALLVSEKGNKINPKYCKIVRISGNSMNPEYRHGDRVIIDENDKELSDGQIFAFRYGGKCYVKEINLMGNKIKCISLNKDYDAFYVNDMAEITVLGRILPRIRL